MTITDPEILSARVLVVDDQRANVQLLEQMLAQAGFTQVMSTTLPAEVAELHRRNRFDLILLDLQMPGMDGFQVMETLKEVDSDSYLPVLVLTGQPSAKLRALQAGARDFVSKPFDVLEIQTRIRNMLEVRLLYKRVENHARKLEQAVQERTLELRESEARFRSLVELASDWYWEQDETGKFTKVSGPALEMLGLAEGDADAAQNAEAPQWNPSDRALLDEKLAMRRPFLDFVYSRVNADGSQQFLQTSGEPKFDETGRFIGYRGIGMDVTGRMGAQLGERRATETLQRFRTAMEATDHGIFLLDRASMRYVDVNQAACRLSGYSRDELLASGPHILNQHPDAGLESRYDRLIAGNDDGFSISREPLLRKDGSLLPVETHRQPSRAESGWMLVELVRELDGAAP